MRWFPNGHGGFAVLRPAEDGTLKSLPVLLFLDEAGAWREPVTLPREAFLIHWMKRDRLMLQPLSDPASSLAVCSTTTALCEHPPLR